MRILVITLLAAFAWAAQAQEVTPPDSPRGAPYNTQSYFPQSGKIDGTLVPLRDYLSSRIDQLRIEMLDRLEKSEDAQDKIGRERDERYAQRFAAQQQALADALSAAKEQVSSALAQAEKAVTKAELAVEKRFESVNEFRQTLTDQATTFMSKAEGDARLNSLTADINKLTQRMDQSQSRSEGAGSLWILIAGLVALGLAIGGFIISAFRRPAVAK